MKLFIIFKLCLLTFLTIVLQVVLSFEDDKGRATGKVRMIVKLSNAAINEYDLNNYDVDALGMDGVSVNGGGNSATSAPLYPNYSGGGGGGAPGSSSAKRRGSGAVMSQMNGAMSVAGSVPGVSYGKDFEYLLQSQVEAANELEDVALLHMTLTGIAVIDLRAVHTFAPNSPSVNLACGKVVATTTVCDTYYMYVLDVFYPSRLSVSCLIATFLLLCRRRRMRARWRTGKTSTSPCLWTALPPCAC